MTAVEGVYLFKERIQREDTTEEVKQKDGRRNCHSYETCLVTSLRPIEVILLIAPLPFILDPMRDA